MKKTLAAAGLMFSLAIPSTLFAASQNDDAVATQKRMEEIHHHLMGMQDLINKMQGAKSETERRNLMNEHSAMMDKSMALLNEVHVMDQVQRRGCVSNPKQNPVITCPKPQTPQSAEVDLMQMIMQMMYLQGKYDATVRKGLEQ